MLQIKSEEDEEVEIEIKEDEELHNPDPYDFVYSNIPKNTHVFKTEENCRLSQNKNIFLSLEMLLLR